MKTLKSKLLFAFFIFFVGATYSQVKFERILGGPGYDFGYSVVQTFDKGYVVAGSSSSFTGTSDMYLVKVDSMGVPLWQQLFGGISVEQGFSLAQTADSGLVISGYTNSFGAGGYDMYLVKTDKAGNFVWSKTYGGTNWDFAYSVQQTSDGGYVIAGGTFSFGGGDEDMYLVKTDQNGDTLWTRTFGGNGEDRVASVIQTSDGGYALAGYTKSFGDTSGDIYTVKTDANGDTLWTKKLGFTGYDEATQIIQTLDGGYMTTAISRATTGTRNDALLVKTDMNGDTTFTKRYGSPNDAGAYSICESSFGGYVWVGKLKIGSKYNVYFYKIDAMGNWNYAYTFGGLSDEDGRYVRQTTDKGYIVTANSNSYNNGLGDIYLFKTDSLGSSSGVVMNLATGIASISSIATEALTVYPNPVTNGDFKVMIQPNQKGQINLYSLTGQLIFSKPFEQENQIHEFEINTSGIDNGMYFIEMQTEDQKYTAKLSILNH